MPEPMSMAAMMGISAGTQMLTGLIGLYQAEKQRGAEQRRLDEIKAAFNAIKPPEYDLTIESPPELVNNLINDPRFNKALEDRYTPQVAEFVEEAAPELIKESSLMKRGREAQEAALGEYERIAGGQEDPRFRLLVERAKKRAQGEAQSRQASLAQNMARRGISGSGLELAAQMGSSAESMDRLADTEMQAAAEAYRNRLDALAQGASLGGTLRNQDLSVQEKNLNLINEFNRRQADRRQQRFSDIADLANEAQMKNIGLNQWKYGAGEASQARDNAIRQGESEWKRRARSDLNELKNRQYQDEMDRLRGIHGIAGEQNRMGREHVRDQQNIYGGLADAVSKTTGMALDYMDEDEKEKRRAMRSGKGGYIPQGAY